MVKARLEAVVQQVKRLAASVVEQFGRVDVLINVAGVNRRKPAIEVTDDDSKPVCTHEC